MKNTLLYILFLCLNLGIISAQQLNYIGLEDGLSSGFVFDFMQSSEGFIYIGLYTGLNRYDGYEVKHFKHNPFDEFSISPQAVNSIAEDSRGYIWLGLESGELDVFNPKTQRFHHLGSFGRQNNKYHQVIQEVFVDPNDDIWVALLSGKAMKLELPTGFGLDGKPASIPYQPMVAHEIQIDKNPNFEPEHELGRNPIRYFLLDSQQRFWMVSYDAQIYRIDWENNTQQLVHQAKERKVRYNPQLFELPDSTLMFCNGVSWQKITGHKIEEIAVSSWFNEAIINGYDDEGHLIYNIGNTARERKGEYGQCTYYRSPIADLQSEQPIADSLFSHTYNQFTKMIEDQSGLFWVKNNIGLVTYNPNAGIFNQAFEGMSVYNLLVDQNGILWTKNNLNKHILFNLQMNSYESIHEIYPSHGSVMGEASIFRKDGYVLGIKSSNNSYKTPLLRNSIFVLFNPKTKEILEYDFEEAAQIREGGLSVFDLNNNLWALKDSELFRLDLETKQSKVHSMGIEKIKIRHVWAYVDAKNQIWSATIMGAIRINIDQYPEREPQFTFFKNDPSDKHSLSHSSIKCFHDDPFEPKKYIWIGTAGGGLNRMNKTSSKCVHYTTLNSDIPDDVVYQIQADAKGNLWLSTNNGLARFNIKTETFKNYTKEDGLQDLEFNTGSSLRISDGKMIFGGINGINIFNPDEDNMEGSTFIPPVRLTELKINNKKIQAYPVQDSLGLKLEQSIEYTKSIELNYKQNTIRLQFAALDFTHKNQNEYRYRLTEGSARKNSSNEEWVDLGTENKVQFTSLNPGEYLFEVIGSNQDQIWNETPSTLAIRIYPPWWKTSWAYFCYAILLLSILGWIYRSQLDKITKDRNAKKAFAEALIFAQEEERKRIARDLHDGVGQSLLLIKKQLDNSKSVTSENQEMIADTLEEVRSISRDLHPYQLDKFGLTNSIENILDKIRSTADIFISSEIDNIDNTIPAKSEIHLYRTIQEAFNNIVKHADASAAKVTIENKQKEVIITIQDNGRGFNHEVAVVKSKSLGLRTMYERISAIDGQLKIENGEPKGTKIKILVPKNQG